MAVCFVQKCAARRIAVAPARQVVYGYASCLMEHGNVIADTRANGTVEECLDELNDLMAGTAALFATVLAMAMRVHWDAAAGAARGAAVHAPRASRLRQGAERDALQYDEE